MGTRIAYCSSPKDGGTYTFYQSLRSGLMEKGWEMFCLTTGKTENSYWDRDFEDDGCVSLAAEESDLKKQSQALADHLVSADIDIFFPMNSVPALSAIPHLEPGIKLIGRCADMHEYGLRTVAYMAPYAQKIVSTTPYQRNSLIERFQIAPDKIVLIPHGTNIELFKPLKEKKSKDKIRLIFVGRLEDTQKGVLAIPDILDLLWQKRVPFVLEIVGQGVHEGQLRDMLAGHLQAERVKFSGRLTKEKVAERLAESDIFLFTSRHEGFGFTIIEAMAAGVVPVANLLPSVTDFIISDQKDGFLVPYMDAGAFAETIERLHLDRGLLAHSSELARKTAVERFSLGKFVADYSRVILDVHEQSNAGRSPEKWENFRICPPCRPSWRSHIPDFIKAPIRNNKWVKLFRDRRRYL